MKFFMFCWTFMVVLIEFKAERTFWNGKWFPNPPGGVDSNPVISYIVPHIKHKNLMGVSQPSCDDGKTNLTVDWDRSADAYVCFNDNWRQYLPELYVQPTLQCDYIPPSYEAMHECMDTPINYADDIPTFGYHRPLWARYGEYNYLPPQRWLHNLEHGAVVMIYHPCADPQEVKKLRNVVVNCLYRHVITPSNKLSPERPIGLVTWGCKLLMSKVDVKIAQEFIRTSALKGPEQTYADGQFDYAFVNPAKIVSDVEDSLLCPS